MSWVKLDDQFASHPKVVRAGQDAFCLHVWALCYAAQYLTDGHVPAGAIRGAQLVRRPAVAARALVSAGLWHEVEGGYQIHDYLDFNPTGEKVKAEREAAAERMRNKRRSSPEHHAEREAKFDDPVPVPDVPTERAARKRATPPPENFVPDQELVLWARDLGLPDPDIRRETAGWLDWCKANGKTFKDHRAAWRTWMRRAKPSTAPEPARVRPQAVERCPRCSRLPFDCACSPELRVVG